MLDLSHTTGTYFPSHLVVLYGCQCHRALCSSVDGVKIVEFFNTVPLSRPCHTGQGTLRGSASFALSDEKVWSKFSWILGQVNLYLS